MACVRGQDPNLKSPASRRLVLASQSPRRRQLLGEAGVAFWASAFLVDDTHLKPGRVGARGWATALAYLKAAGAARGLRERGELRDGDVVLGSDTVVALGEELIGKPVDGADAGAIVRRLENRRHEVLTGVAIVDTATGGRTLFCDQAGVEVGPIGEERIGAYVASGRWAGKAGAYNLEEQVRAGWPITWSGDPTTVMGLPMRRLLPELAKLGIGLSVQGAGARKEAVL